MQIVPDCEAKSSLDTLLDRCQPQEVAAVLGELRAGRLSGQWEDECVIGIVARGRGQCYRSAGLACEETQPIEQWLKGIVWGQTPATNEGARLLETWLVEWLEDRTLVVGERQAVSVEEAL